MTPVELFFLAGDPEPRAVIFAKEQPQFAEIPALIYRNGYVLTEWELTDAERAGIARGENLRVWIATDNGPMQPFALEVTNEHVA